MKLAALLGILTLAAQARELPFGGNTLTVDRFADYQIGDHRVALKRGVAVFHLMDSGSRPVEIVTPSVSVQPFFVGDYRVEVTRSGQSIITPYGGDLRVVAPQGAQWIAPGEKMIARGSALDPQFRIVSAVSRWRRLLQAMSLMRIGVGVAADVSSGSDSPRHHRSDNKPSVAKTDNGKAPPRSPSAGGSRSTSAPARGSGGGSHSSSATDTASHSSGGSSHGNAASPHSPAPSAHNDSASHASTASAHSDSASHSSSTSSRGK